MTIVNNKTKAYLVITKALDKLHLMSKTKTIKSDAVLVPNKLWQRIYEYVAINNTLHTRPLHIKERTKLIQDVSVMGSQLIDEMLKVGV